VTGFGWVAGVGVGAGVVEQVLDGLGGGVGDGDPDGHLVLVGPVQDLDVQGGVEGFADLGRAVVNLPAARGMAARRAGSSAAAVWVSSSVSCCSAAAR
jgi:hypothetical protein